MIIWHPAGTMGLPLALMLVEGGMGVSAFGFRQTLEVRTLGCARRFDPLPTHSSPNRRDLNYQTEQHKRHKIYTGSGHHCGVIPYSSVVVVGCLLG